VAETRALGREPRTTRITRQVRLAEDAAANLILMGPNAARRSADALAIADRSMPVNHDIEILFARRNRSGSADDKPEPRTV
jgi:hypothetical protein